MKHIAFVTPWPPQESGIADYVYDLVQGLKSSEFKIDIFTNCQQAQKLKEIKIFKITDTLPNLSSYDLVIYEMGNNYEFHAYMLDLLKLYGGIVHIHDIVLHHLIVEMTYAQGKEDEYLAIIQKWYGEEIKHHIQELFKHHELIWDGNNVIELPLFEEILQYAGATIVHSHFAKELINKKFPNLQVFQIDQLYKNAVLSQKPDKKAAQKVFKIGILGGVTVHKRVDIVLKAFQKILAKFPNSQLHIVGNIQHDCNSIHDLIKELNITQQVYIHGRVNEKVFNNIFDQMDLCVSLRYPTMGETSAVVMKSMQKGIPVIVTNIGWYKELPRFVDKVSPEGMELELYKLFRKYIGRKWYLFWKRRKFIQYAQKSLRFDEVVKKYANILSSLLNQKVESLMINQIAPVLTDMHFLDNDFFLKNFVKKTKDLF